MALLTGPDGVIRCDGSEGERRRITEELVDSDGLIPLNPDLRPNSYLARSDLDDVGERLGRAAPRMFRVNWFRKDTEGRFVWLGFGDDIRVLDWITRRLELEVEAVPTPIGLLPRRHDLDLDGLELDDDAVRMLLTPDVPGWRSETRRILQHLERFGERLPTALRRRLGRLEHDLNACTCP